MPRVYFRLVNAKHMLLFPLHSLDIDAIPTVRLIRHVVFIDLREYLDGATETSLRVFPTVDDCRTGNALRASTLLYGMGNDRDQPLIVQVPTDFQMSDWNLDVVQWCPESEPYPPSRSGDGDTQIVHIPGRYRPQEPGWMRVFGKKDQLVYPRQEVVELWRAIQTHAIDASDTLLSIIGSPGSGSTCAAFAFACGRVDRSVWDVVWVEYHPVALRCVKFEGACRSSCTVHTGRNWSILMAQLLPSTTTPPRPTVVFFDEYLGATECCTRAFASFLDWRRGDPVSSRLVQVHATPNHRDGYVDPLLASCRDSEDHTVVAFTLPAWTVQACIAAVEHDALFAHVAQAFREDSDPDPLPHDLSVEQRRQRVVRKFDTTGGNVKLLFDEQSMRHGQVWILRSSSRLILV